ncbi:hypothetical protein CRUP_010956 [Coryphaenoides rupestris]|nr:hypothetical protein CRUP_010956 [Coryphaenoides rupestris]
MAPFSEPSSRSLLVGSTARLVSVPRKFSELSLVLLTGLREMSAMEYTPIRLATVPVTSSEPYRSKACTGSEGDLYCRRGFCSRSFHTWWGSDGRTDGRTFIWRMSPSCAGHPLRMSPVRESSRMMKPEEKPAATVRPPGLTARWRITPALTLLYARRNSC